jgi:DNA-binding CsgD family transcriptional regulator
MEKEIVISTIENFLKEHNSQYPIFLSKRELAVLDLRRQGKTLQEIGDRLKLTRERVRQIETNALARQMKSRELAGKLYETIKDFLFTEEELESSFSLWYTQLNNADFLEEKMRLQDFVKILWENKNKLKKANGNPPGENKRA